MTTESLDINRLIEVTQDLVHDGMMTFAAEGRKRVQEIRVGDTDFVLEVVMRVKP